jgi:hypothetical protein
MIPDASVCPCRGERARGNDRAEVCVETSVYPKENWRTKSCCVHGPRHAYAIVRFDGGKEGQAAVQRRAHGVAALEPRCRKEQRQRIRRLERGGFCRGASQQFADRIRKRLPVGSSKRCATSSKKPSGRRKQRPGGVCARVTCTADFSFGFSSFTNRTNAASAATPAYARQTVDEALRGACHGTSRLACHARR